MLTSTERHFSLRSPHLQKLKIVSVLYVKQKSAHFLFLSIFIFEQNYLYIHHEVAFYFRFDGVDSQFISTHTSVYFITTGFAVRNNVKFIFSSKSKFNSFSNVHQIAELMIVCVFDFPFSIKRTGTHNEIRTMQFSFCRQLNTSVNIIHFRNKWNFQCNRKRRRWFTN